MDVVTAAAILGVGRTAAYELIRTGTHPDTRQTHPDPDQPPPGSDPTATDQHVATTADP